MGLKLRGPPLGDVDANFPKLTIQLVRDKFKELIKAHEAIDKLERKQSGGGDAVVDETLSLLDDLLSQYNDFKDEKIREKTKANDIETRLKKDGGDIRDAAMSTLGKRPKPGEFRIQIFFKLYFPRTCLLLQTTSQCRLLGKWSTLP